MNSTLGGGGSSLAPPFHLIKRSSTRTLALISAEIPTQTNTSSALMANIPALVKASWGELGSSSNLLRNSLQQLQIPTSNKMQPTNTPSPKNSQSLSKSHSIITPRKSEVSQANTNIKPVRRKEPGFTTKPVVPHLKIPEKFQNYAAFSQLKSPSKQTNSARLVDLASDSVFVVITGDVLNEPKNQDQKNTGRKSYEIVQFDKSLQRIKQVIPCGSFSIFVAEAKESEKVFLFYKENTLLHPTKKVENIHSHGFLYCGPSYHYQLREINYKAVIRDQMHHQSNTLDPYVLQDSKSLELIDIYGTQGSFMLRMRNNLCLFVHFAENADKTSFSFFEEYAGGNIEWIECSACSNTLVMYAHARGRTNYLLDYMVLEPEPHRRKLPLPDMISQQDIRIIRVGLGRVMIVTNHNKLYIYRNEKNHPNIESNDKFELVDYKWPSTIKQVRCGGHHNLVLLQNGAIFAWGFNNHYQCGFYENIKNKLPSISITPFYIPKNIIPSEITDIQCSFLSSAIITNNGVYIIGDLTAKANAFAKSNEDLRFLTLPFSKFNFLLNAASGGADHFVLFTHNENSEGSQGYFSKNLSELLHIESSIIPSVTSRSNGSNDSSSFKYSTDFSTR